MTAYTNRLPNDSATGKLLLSLVIDSVCSDNYVYQDIDITGRC